MDVKRDRDHPVIDEPWNYNLIGFKSIVNDDDIEQSYIDLTLHQGSIIKRLRFYGPINLRFPLPTKGIQILDVSDRQEGRFCVEVSDSSGALFFNALEVINLDDEIQAQRLLEKSKHADRSIRVEFHLGNCEKPFCLYDPMAVDLPLPFAVDTIEHFASDGRAFICVPHLERDQVVRICIGEYSSSEDIPFKRIWGGGGYLLRIPSGRLKLAMPDDRAGGEERVIDGIPPGNYEFTIIDVNCDPNSVTQVIRDRLGESQFHLWEKADKRQALALAFAFISVLFLIIVTFFSPSLARGLVIGGVALTILALSALTMWHYLRLPELKQLHSWKDRLIEATPKFVLELHRLPDDEVVSEKSGVVHRPNWQPEPIPDFT